MLSETLRRQVRQRAGNRCEYCMSHQDYVLGQLQVDQIVPVAKGGADAANNLCLACELCNQYKWTRTRGPDPQTAKQVALFNPRRQKWAQHFCWSEDGVEVIGLTPCGRATVAVLRLNNSLALTVRRHWVSAGWHPPEA
jgi:hypothetical protein